MIDSILKKFTLLFFLLILSDVGFSQNINDGLIGFYPFNGNADDQSSLSPINDGSITGASFECGPMGSAIAFNNITDYVKLNTNFYLDTSYTISFWLKPNRIKHSSIFAMRNQCPASFRGWDRANITLSGLNERDYLKDIAVSVPNQLVIAHFRSNINCQEWSNLYGYTIPGFQIDTLCFTHIAITVENNFDNVNRDYSIYINGQFYKDTLYNIPADINLVNTIDPFDLPNPSFESFFGKTHNNFDETRNQFPFLGALDHVRIYNRKITAAEVQLLYNEREPTTPPTLIFDRSSLCLNETYTVSVSSLSSCDNYYWLVNDAVVSTDTFITLQKTRVAPDIVSLIYSPRNLCELERIFQVFNSKPIRRDTLYKTICRADSFLFGKKWIKTEGVYSDTLLCDSITTLNLTVVDLPVTKNLGSDLTICDDEPLLLNVSTAEGSYQWQDGSTDPTFLVKEKGSYSVTISTACASKQDTVLIETEDCRCYISVPNVFTPNRDNVNDEFFPLSKCDYIDFQFIIFNRWGIKVFESNASNQNWDGTHSGQDVSEGVYLYTFSYKTEREQGNIVGNVVLVR